MTTGQTSLTGSYHGAAWRSQLSSILERTLKIVRDGYDQGEPLSEPDLDRALDLIRQITVELRITHDDTAPFG